MMKLKTLLLLSLSLILTQSCEPKIGQGGIMPEFDLMLPDSTVFNTSSIPTGQPIVMIYYDGMCNKCHDEVKEIVGHMGQFTATRFYLVTLEPLPEVVRFKKYLKLDFYRNIVVAKDTGRYLPQFLQNRETPQIAVFDRNKILKGVFQRKPPIDTLIKRVNRL